MLSGSMTKGSVRITASPSQDGSTVNDEITSPDEPLSNGLQSREDKERFVQRGSGYAATFALLRWAGNAQASTFVQRQATGQGQSRPALQPVAHILIR